MKSADEHDPSPAPAGSASLLDVDEAARRAAEAPGLIHFAGAPGGATALLASRIAERTRGTVVLLVADVETARHAYDDLVATVGADARCALLPAPEAPTMAKICPA